MVSVGMHEARSNLSKRVDRALEGEDVTITRNGTPVARIVPVQDHTPSMSDCLGSWKGQVDIGDPFEPLPDWLQELFDGTTDETRLGRRADRLLMAQALVEDAVFISADERLDAYGVKRRW